MLYVWVALEAKITFVSQAVSIAASESVPITTLPIFIVLIIISNYIIPIVPSTYKTVTLKDNKNWFRVTQLGVFPTRSLVWCFSIEKSAWKQNHVQLLIRSSFAEARGIPMLQRRPPPVWSTEIVHYIS